MNAEALKLLYAYNKWAWSVAWECVDTLSPSRFLIDAGFSAGSVRNQLVTYMSDEQRWLARWLDLPIPAHLDQKKYANARRVKNQWLIIFGGYDAILDTLDSDILLSTAVYKIGKQRHEDAVWKILLRGISQSTDRRTQLYDTLSRLGAKTGSQRFVDFVSFAQREGYPLGFDVEFLDIFADYTTWVFQRIWQMLMENAQLSNLLTDPAEQQNPIVRDIHKLAFVEEQWLSCLPDYEPNHDVNLIMQAFARSGAETYLQQNPNRDDLLLFVEVNLNGVVHTYPVWAILFHTMNNRIQRVSQLLNTFQRMRLPAWEQDMMLYFWEWNVTH